MALQRAARVRSPLRAGGYDGAIDVAASRSGSTTVGGRQVTVRIVD